MFRNMKLKTKNALGFAVVVGIMVIMTIIILLQISFLSRTVEQITGFSFKVNNAMWTAKESLQNLNAVLLDSAMLTDQSKLKENAEAAAQNADTAKNCLNYAVTAYTDAKMSAPATQVQALIAPMDELIRIQGELFDAMLQGVNDGSVFRRFATEYKPLSATVSTEMEIVRATTKTDIDTLTLLAAGASRLLIIVAVISIAVNVLVSILITKITTRSIVKPISSCAKRLDLLAAGDLTSSVPDIRSKDEIGRLAKSTQQIVTTIGGMIQDLDYGLHEIGMGNLTVNSKAKELYVGDFSALAASMYAIIGQLTDTISQINISSQQVFSGADQVSSGAQALSQGATEQASSIEELTATITEISRQVAQNAGSTANARRVITQTAESVQYSNQQMAEMVQAMNNIASTSNEINKIIKTIDDIAFQTNILALNAAVEAARAGAAGKGFAVVADEVRNLAGKSAEAAKTTTALIANSITAVANGTQIAGNTAKSLESMVVGAQESSSLINEIAHSSDEQAEAIKQVTLGIEQISGVVQTNSATAEESAAASEELSSQAQTLSTLVGRFQLKSTVKV